MRPKVAQIYEKLLTRLALYGIIYIVKQGKPWKTAIIGGLENEQITKTENDLQ